MFGDALMILEFLNHFGDLFELRDDFPAGFSLDLLENALFSKTYDSALCNILLFYLDSIFKCYDEEHFDGETDDESDAELAEDDESEAENGDGDGGGDGGGESSGDGVTGSSKVHLEQQLFRQPASQVADRDSYADMADELCQLVRRMHGRPVKNIGLDVYTISEMLRLYFLTSGAEHASKSKFWFQQRGGYTRMDEAGVDFGLSEKHILSKLETKNVFELEPVEKLKILTCLCHQLMSQTRFRDLVEDNFQKMSTLRAQLRDLQTIENRRIREEVSERWRKRMQEAAKEKEAKQSASNTSNETPTTAGSKPATGPTSAPQGLNLTKEEMAEQAKLLDEKQTAESNRRREEFLKRERQLIDELYQLQLKCSMNPVGKDRFCRRYWLFKSLPGVFVENDNYEHLSFPPSVAATTTEQKVTPDSGSEAADDVQQKLAKTTTSTKAEPAEATTETSNGEEHNSAAVEMKHDEQNLTAAYAASNGGGLESVGNDCCWSFYHTAEEIEILIRSLSQRGIRESELKQSLDEFKDKLAEQLAKNTAVVKNLTMTQEEIEASLKNCLKENVYNVMANNASTGGYAKKTKQNKAAAAQPVSNTSTSFISAQECMEIDLRDQLVELQEQIYVGALGSLKVNDRHKWKEALLTGYYDAQCSSLAWGDQTRSALEITNCTGLGNFTAILTPVENSSTQSNVSWFFFLLFLVFISYRIKNAK